MKNTKQITCTVDEAIKKGLAVGDRFVVVQKYKLVSKKAVENTALVRLIEGGEIGDYYMHKDTIITFEAKDNSIYEPKDREFCAVLTKTGLTTECEAYHCKGEIYAIPMKDGKPDGIFSPNQIEKFYKL